MSSCDEGGDESITEDCLSEKSGSRKGRQRHESAAVSAKFKRNMKKRSEDGSFSKETERRKSGSQSESRGCKETRTEIRTVEMRERP